jgi:hypothetical protein
MVPLSHFVIEQRVFVLATIILQLSYRILKHDPECTGEANRSANAIELLSRSDLLKLVAKGNSY